jgi:hypothetical protein
MPKKDKNKDFGKKIQEMLPEGFEWPERCGFCSYKAKCRKRSAKSTEGKKVCFPLELQKVACGNEDGEGNGDVCELPKIGGDCNYNDKMMKLIEPKIRSRMKKMPPSMRHGLMKMLTNMPHGKCVEKGDKCACCCFPYEPNEDGTACVEMYMCKTPEEAGVGIDMNIGGAWDWDALF